MIAAGRAEVRDPFRRGAQFELSCLDIVQQASGPLPFQLSHEPSYRSWNPSNSGPVLSIRRTRCQRFFAFPPLKRSLHSFSETFTSYFLAAVTIRFQARSRSALLTPST